MSRLAGRFAWDLYGVGSFLEAVLGRHVGGSLFGWARICAVCRVRWRLRHCCGGMRAGPGTLRLDTVPIPLNVNEITLTVPAKTQDPRRETTAATTDDNPHTPHTLLLSVAKATGSTTNTVDPVAKGTGPTVGSITVRMEPESSGDVEMTDVAGGCACQCHCAYSVLVVAECYVTVEHNSDVHFL